MYGNYEQITSGCRRIASAGRVLPSARLEAPANPSCKFGLKVTTALAAAYCACPSAVSQLPRMRATTLNRPLPPVDRIQ